MVHTDATPLWAKCEGEAHTPKIGKLESSGTPKNSELDFRGQISSHLSILSVIEEVLKCRCPKWPCIGHLDICSPSYGQKKDRESNWQFDSWPLKFRNRPAPDVRWESATRRWQALGESYKFGSDLVLIRGRGEKLWCPKVWGVQNQDSFATPLWESRDKQPLGCGCGGVTQRILSRGWWWHLPSSGRGVSCESELTRGLSQHQMHAEWVLTNLCWFWRQVRDQIAWSLPSIIPGLLTRPSTPFSAGSRERPPSPNFPQLHIVEPSSGFNKGLRSASLGIRA
jgi:hypothetical protein